MKKILLFAMLCFGAFFAACDDSSSSPADETNQQEPNVTSSDSSDPNGAGVSSSSDAQTVVSSSSQPGVNPNNGAIEIPLSSSFEEADDCFDGNAKITISNIENLNMDCSSAKKGYTIYDKDKFILHTCDGTQWIEEDVIPCSLDF